MGVAKAALESVNRYLARDLGARGLRSNLVSAGPIKTIASGSIPGFEILAGAWDAQAPLAWDPKDAGPVADACLFLLSGLARGVTGEIVHVDGGYHALGAPLAPPPPESPTTARAERVDRAPPQLGEHADRLVDVAPAAQHLDRQVALDHRAQRLRGDPRGDVVGRDAALLVARDARLGAGDEARDVGLPLRPAGARARRAGSPRACRMRPLRLTTATKRPIARRSSRRGSPAPSKYGGAGRRTCR